MKHCFFCGTNKNIHLHECIHGPNRKNSIKHGLVIPLCGYHHNLSDEGVHLDPEKDRKVKQIAQRKFEENHTREEFMQIFGKNYL